MSYKIESRSVVHIRALHEWESSAYAAVEEAFVALASIAPPLPDADTDVFLIKTKDGKWHARTQVNVKEGRCACCSDGGLEDDDIAEIRLVRLTVEP